MFTSPGHVKIERIVYFISTGNVVFINLFNFILSLSLFLFISSLLTYFRL